MVCHVLWLETESECGACGHDVPAGYRVITDQLQMPFYVVVCKDCTAGLDDVRAARKLLTSTRRVAGTN